MAKQEEQIPLFGEFGLTAQLGSVEYTSRGSWPTRTTTFAATFTNDHRMGASVRLTIGSSAVLNKGDTLVLKILVLQILVLGVTRPGVRSDSGHPGRKDCAGQCVKNDLN